MMFDQAVAFVVVTFTVIACFRGFIKEFLGVTGLAVSLVGTVMTNDLVVDSFLQAVPSRFVAQISGGIATFVIFLVITGFINSVLLKKMAGMRHNILDSILGGVVGCAKGYAICFAVYIAVYSSAMVLNPELDEEDSEVERSVVLPEWLQNSRLYPVFFSTHHYIDSVFKVEAADYWRHLKKDAAEPKALTPSK